MIKRERFVITTMMMMMAAALILGVATTTAISCVYAQEEEDEEEEEEETSAETTTSPLEQSDNLLTARINGDIFTTGQTITVTGTVEERGFDSVVNIQIIDPSGEIVHSALPRVSADNTFQYSFEAGIQPRFSVTPPMDQSGNYRMTLQYLNPANNFGEDTFRSEIEFVFAYTHVPGQEGTAATGTTTTTPTTPSGRTVNVTALNGIVIQGLERVQILNNTLTSANASEQIMGQLATIQDAFMNIRGNLTGAPPRASAVQ
jgi:hypothetical protein